MPVTIRDVARFAGCSIKTVSRVINNEPFVTAETRGKVLAAIRAVGYAPNISARRLAENKSFMISILMMPDFYQMAAEMLLPVMDIGYQEDYDILVQAYDPPNTLSKQKLVSLIYEHRIDGFVITPPLDVDGFIEDMLSTYKVPHVFINPKDRPVLSPSIKSDDFQGAHAMTEYLVSLGHRRIAFLSGPESLRSSVDRQDGYLKALRDHEIPIDPNLLRGSDWTFESGYRRTRDLFRGDACPTAIFAGSDQAAYGAIFAAQEMGLLVPNQLSICGFDDLGTSAKIWPGLTTIHQPVGELIAIAAQWLIDVLKGKEVQQLEVAVPSRLVIRGSSTSPMD